MCGTGKARLVDRQEVPMAIENRVNLAAGCEAPRFPDVSRRPPSEIRRRAQVTAIPSERRLRYRREIGQHDIARGQNSYASDREDNTLCFRRSHSCRRSVAHGRVSTVGCCVRRSAEFA
jgi:hypothetical protein